MGVIGDKLRARLGASRATSTPTPTPTTSATATTAAATVAQNSSNNSRPRRSLSAKLYGSGADSSSSGEDDDEVQEPEFTQNDLDYSQDSSEEEMQEEEESEESEAAEEDDEDFEEEYGDPVKTDPGRTTRSSRKQTSSSSLLSRRRTRSSSTPAVQRSSRTSVNSSSFSTPRRSIINKNVGRNTSSTNKKKNLKQLVPSSITTTHSARPTRSCTFNNNSDDNDDTKLSFNNNNLDDQESDPENNNLSSSTTDIQTTPSFKRLTHVRHQLHLSYVPKTMPGRDAEFNQLYELLYSAVEDGAGSCVYISGVPGTGKTATVHRVLDLLQKAVDNGKLQDFDYEEVNGMKVSDPQQAYIILHQKLTGKRVSAVQAADQLEKMFSSSGGGGAGVATVKGKNVDKGDDSQKEDDDEDNDDDGEEAVGKRRGRGRSRSNKTKMARKEGPVSTQLRGRKPCILVVDEMDLLITRGQKVIYNLFDWPNRPHSPLIVVAISNTIDLPERVFLNRISSRIGLQRIDFKPYNFQQLGKIVESRLEIDGGGGNQDEDEGMDEDDEDVTTIGGGKTNVMDKDSVQMCVRKVASVSGDARKALDICRLSIEILQQKLLASSSSPPPSSNSTQRTRSANNKLVVTLDIVQEAIKRTFATPALQQLARASLHQMLFLASLVRRVRVCGRADVSFYEVLQEHMAICIQHSIPPPSFSAISRVAAELGTARWVLVEADTGGRDGGQRVRLNLMEEDVVVTLKNASTEEGPGKVPEFVKKLVK